MPATAPATDSMIGEKELRRHIDRAVSRALVDREYASMLLADPTIVLEDRGCPAQEFLSLLSIHATNLVDFARQAQALFWMAAPVVFHSRPNLPRLRHGAHRPLAAAASR